MNETTNPLFKARYSGLIWDFSKIAIEKDPNAKIGIIYIESLVETAKKRISNHKLEIITKLERATDMAILRNNQELIQEIIKVALDFEKEISIKKEPSLCGFSFDMLIENKKVKLTIEEESEIIGILESNFNELILEEYLNFTVSVFLADKLSKYYHKKGQEEKVRDILISFYESFTSKENKFSAIQVTSWLQKFHKLFINYNLNNDAKEILIRIRESGKKINNELAPISSSFTITKNEIDQYISYFTSDDSEIVIQRIISMFIPNSEEIKTHMFNSASSNLISNFFAKSIHDNKGRLIANIGPLNKDLEGNLLSAITLDINVNTFLLRIILREITEKQILTVEQILAFINQSPLFEKSRLEIIKRGLHAYYSGDLIVAIHLLIPQIEEAIRNLIELSGGNVLKCLRNTDYFQVMSLGDVLKDPIIESTFNKDIQIYFRVLFTESIGWNLRNDICHGLSEINTFSYYTADRLIHVILILGLLRYNENLS